MSDARGIRRNERTGELGFGPRPPLGLLVFDDGATYTVDAIDSAGWLRKLTVCGNVKRGRCIHGWRGGFHAG